jgi:hypothetical protein
MGMAACGQWLYASMGSGRITRRGRSSESWEGAERERGAEREDLRGQGEGEGEEEGEVGGVSPSSADVELRETERMIWATARIVRPLPAEERRLRPQRQGRSVALLAVLDVLAAWELTLHISSGSSVRGPSCMLVMLRVCSGMVAGDGMRGWEDEFEREGRARTPAFMLLRVL